MISTLGGVCFPPRVIVFKSYLTMQKPYTMFAARSGRARCFGTAVMANGDAMIHGSFFLTTWMNTNPKLTRMIG